LSSRHEVVSVVSQPDRARGRGRKSSPSPISQIALREGLPLYRPERAGGARDPEILEGLLEDAPDLGVVVAFGQFLPKTIRELPRLGMLINAHASLLPRYRGAAPIARAILEGETRTGISVMRVEREMDAGPVALVCELSIGPDENTGELTGRMGELAADAIAQAVEEIAAGRVAWKEQDHANATEAPKIERADAELAWQETSDALVRRVRALAPKPGAVTWLDGEPLRILAARSLEGPVEDPPGTLRRGDDPLVRVACGKGWLVPLRIQRAGGKPLETAAYLRGRDLPEGAVLGTPS